MRRCRPVRPELLPIRTGFEVPVAAPDVGACGEEAGRTKASVSAAARLSEQQDLLGGGGGEPESLSSAA